MAYNALKWGEDKRIGLIYWNWTILKRIGKIKTHSTYLCKCICGTEKIIKYLGNKLQSKSCGCKKWEKRYKRPAGPKNILKAYSSILVRYIRDAKERNLEFKLEESDFLKLVQSNCYYCNKLPNNHCGYNGNNIKYSGIDRVNNNKGYLIQNCVSCCKECNTAKKSITPDIIYKAYHFLFGNK